VSPPFARKRFGQHFLVQPTIAERIVTLADLDDSAVVLEIGPGRGALTRLLAPRCRRLVLVEVDRDLCRQLQTAFADRDSVEIICGDILRTDLSALLAPAPSVTAVANLPYNISTPVLMKLLEDPTAFRRFILMLQREVAERICAVPDNKSYGALSVVVQVVASPRIALRVPPSAFAPRPQVESAVVMIEPRRPPPLDAHERRALRRVIRTVFAQRRKQLGNALAPLTSDPRAVLSALDIDPRRRPETLPPADFVRLAHALDLPPPNSGGEGNE
jgi:16S rRNA (adenine1518-N6/adenine1519-N6)-dimethyltransferase